jgi:hypothetical protein
MVESILSGSEFPSFTSLFQKPIRRAKYAASAEHTLRGMASNLAAKAYKIVWARFGSTSPARVLQAISEKCAQAASLEEPVTKRFCESNVAKMAMASSQ